LNLALKREIAENEPHIWQARASVELVHDLNNPLTVVIGYAALLVEEAKAVAAVDPERGKKLLDYAAMVERASEYCHHLSENWRQASRKSSEFATLDLVQVAHEVRQVVFFGNAAIQLQGITTATVRGSKYELMRIFQNVFKNSLEAGATRLCVAFAREGRNHEVTIRDNGTGMMPEAVKKALGGGFSNKESGTGMGLSICRHLLGIHGAALKMESKPGQGTTVVLIFPAADS